MRADAIRFADADGALLPGSAGNQWQGEIPHLDPPPHPTRPPVKDGPSNKVCGDEDTAAANHPFMSATLGVRLTRGKARIVIWIIVKTAVSRTRQMKLTGAGAGESAHAQRGGVHL